MATQPIPESDKPLKDRLDQKRNNRSISPVDNMPLISGTGQAKDKMPKISTSAPGMIDKMPKVGAKKP